MITKYWKWIDKFEINAILPSLTVGKIKNGYNSSKHGLCSRFLFRNDMCYIMIFWFNLFRFFNAGFIRPARYFSKIQLSNFRAPGFGIYGVDIFVKTDDAEKAVQLIKEINNQEWRKFLTFSHMRANMIIEKECYR